MTRTRKLLLAAAASALPVLASATPGTAPAPRVAVKSELTDAQRAAYREIFAAVRDKKWSDAAARLDGMGDGPLHAVARAELYTAAGSPKVDLEPLLALIARAPELPHAAQLARMAQTRGAAEPPAFVQPQSIVGLGSQPRRSRAPKTHSDPVATELEEVVQPLIVDDRPSEAEAQYLAWAYRLSREAQTEFLQRIGWSYYLTGRDADARRLLEQAAGGIGEWAVHGAWAAGLAAWRMGDYPAASNSFARVGTSATDPELGAAGLYWAARADTRARRPERVQARLRLASQMSETFYGLLAAEALGLKAPPAHRVERYGNSAWRGIASKPNIRAAIALAELGEEDLASSLIKHQARIGAPSEHDALIHLAADLDFVATQTWLAHNGPRGARINFAARYPMPSWAPARGWRVDKPLVLAHALQESNFRVSAVSPAGATGLLQVRPGTAGDMARARGEALDPASLTDPVQNLEFGQSYIEYLRDLSGTGGLLPKVIAAYNAGPAPIAEWNTRAMDGGDPLLYIESIPYWETRGYVPIVLRNYWVYEAKAGKEGPSRKALAQGMWPRFPGLPGASAIRMSSQRTASTSAPQSPLP
jgi:soluble lytic murein transglycosylase